MKASCVTRDGFLVTPGQLWQSLDRREQDRVVQILDVVEFKNKPEEFYAIIQHFRRDLGIPRGPKSCIAIRRMYTHSTGWKLVRE